MARFKKSVIAALDESGILGIRVGRRHRFIGVWPVVVQGRLFVRSYTQKPDGWYRTLQNERQVWIAINGRRMAVRAMAVRSERLNAAVDAAYREKYNTPGSLKYVRGFKRPARRKTTTEFVLHRQAVRGMKVVKKRASSSSRPRGVYTARFTLARQR